MAELNECVAYLSQEIGPRPAGTEEEQRAALYISETLSAETGLPTTMEDFQCNPDSTLPRALVGGVAVLMTLVATIFSVVSVASIVIGFLCVLLLAAEIFDKPVLSRLLNRGASQNVVAKYVPLKSAKQASRRRKVIIVAHYDSGKIRRDLNSAVITALPLLYWVEFAAMVLMPVLLLVRMIVTPADGALIAFNVALAVAMAVAVLPTLSFALEKLSTYNDGANCNASGVAVLLDVAARVAASRDIPDGDEPLIHGAAAAASAGLVPEGTELVYDVPSNTDELDSSMESAAERLAAAKAAVAALSGKPVDETEAVTSPAGLGGRAPDRFSRYRSRSGSGAGCRARGARLVQEGARAGEEAEGGEASAAFALCCRFGARRRRDNCPRGISEERHRGVERPHARDACFGAGRFGGSRRPADRCDC